jgi:hypothetical protein
MRCAYPPYQEPGSTGVHWRDEDKNRQARRTPMLAISSIALRAAFCIAASHDRNDGMRFGNKANGRRN